MLPKASPSQNPHSLADSLPALLVQADRVAETVAQGVHGRRKRGSGDSFWQFRPYHSSEPARRIDWRQSAKSDQHYVREYEWEAAQTVWIWRDGSPSMNWQSSRKLPTKQDRADLISLALGALLLRGNEQISTLGSEGAPCRGRQSLERFARLLCRSPENLPDQTPVQRFGDLVLIGDFLSPLEEVEAALKGFAQNHIRGHILQISDPFEETFPYRGHTLFQGLENEQTLSFGKAENVQKDYLARLAERHDRLSHLAHTLGWTFQRHRTDQPAQGALLCLYQSLSLAGRGR